MANIFVIQRNLGRQPGNVPIEADGSHPLPTSKRQRFNLHAAHIVSPRGWNDEGERGGALGAFCIG